jgi:hypothetical protein
MDLPKFMDKKYIISSLDLSRYQQVFELCPKNGIRRVYGHLPCQPISLNLNVIQPVPKAVLQVRDTIIDILIDMYLRECNFDLAMRLISISPSTIRRHYVKIFGRYRDQLHRPRFKPSPIKNTHIRLSRTLMLLSDLYDGMAFLGNHGRDKYIAMETTVKLLPRTSADLYPWCYTGRINIAATTKPEIVDHPNFVSVACGFYLTDICYIAGIGRAGVITTSFVKTPIINLVFRNSEGDLIAEAGNTYQEFRSFARLIERCFNPNAGVFITIAEDEVMKILPLN